MVVREILPTFEASFRNLPSLSVLLYFCTNLDSIYSQKSDFAGTGAKETEKTEKFTETGEVGGSGASHLAALVSLSY